MNKDQLLVAQENIFNIKHVDLEDAYKKINSGESITRYPEDLINIMVSAVGVRFDIARDLAQLLKVIYVGVSKEKSVLIRGGIESKLISLFNNIENQGATSEQISPKIVFLYFCFKEGLLSPEKITKITKKRTLNHTSRCCIDILFPLVAEFVHETDEEFYCQILEHFTCQCGHYIEEKSDPKYGLPKNPPQKSPLTKHLIDLFKTDSQKALEHLEEMFRYGDVVGSLKHVILTDNANVFISKFEGQNQSIEIGLLDPVLISSKCNNIKALDYAYMCGSTSIIEKIEKTSIDCICSVISGSGKLVLDLEQCSNRSAFLHASYRFVHPFFVEFYGEKSVDDTCCRNIIKACNIDAFVKHLDEMRKYVTYICMWDRGCLLRLLNLDASEINNNHVVAAALAGSSDCLRTLLSINPNLKEEPAPYDNEERKDTYLLSPLDATILSGSFEAFKVLVDEFDVDVNKSRLPRNCPAAICFCTGFYYGFKRIISKNSFDRNAIKGMFFGGKFADQLDMLGIEHLSEIPTIKSPVTAFIPTKFNIDQEAKG